MALPPMPPLVDVAEVRVLRQSLAEVAAGDGFVLWVDPMVDHDVAIPSAEILQHRLRFMLRVAAYSSYVLGERVVKIAGVGHPSPAATDPAANYLRTAGAINYLRLLVKSGFSSLELIADWATDDGLAAPLEYTTAIADIVRSLAFVHASGLPRSERLDTLDLWYSDTHQPDAPSRQREGEVLLSGHVIEAATDGGRAAAVSIGNPLALRINGPDAAHRARAVLDAGVPDRPVLVRVSERYPQYREVLSGLDDTRVPVIVMVDVDLGTGADCDRKLTDALDTGTAVQKLGLPLAGIAFTVPQASRLQTEFECAFQVLDLVLEQRRQHGGRP
jgi:hypothetical protein